ncbi:MAG: hypothetical protein JNG84_02845 [Archangium sp.]|nr:hypothetical protein [Archangium sp.]
MSRRLAPCLALALCTAAPAFACWPRTSHTVISFFGIPLGVRTHVQPCVEVAPVVVAPPPPQVVYVPAPTPPPAVVYVPMAAPVAPVAPAPPPPPPPTVQAKVRDDDGPATIGLKYLPGSSSSLSATGSTVTFGQPGFAHSLGLEVRVNRWFAFRSDYERRADSHSWDALGVKLSVPTKVLSPYVSASLSGSEAYATANRFQLGAVGAIGVDLKVGRHFFFEAELRYRTTPSSCCRDVPQLTGLIGGGVAFF